jgi:hypothetical protein
MSSVGIQKECDIIERVDTPLPIEKQLPCHTIRNYHNGEKIW